MKGGKKSQRAPLGATRNPYGNDSNDTSLYVWGVDTYRQNNRITKNLPSFTTDKTITNRVSGKRTQSKQSKQTTSKH